MKQKISRLDAWKPVRKIGMSHRSITGRVAFGTKFIPFESALERDFLILQDFDIRVDDVLEQPCRIDYIGADSKQHFYTPDFLVEYETGERVLFEVKYRMNLKENWDVLKPRFRAAIKYAKFHAMRFSIATEIEIRGGSYLANAKFLRSYRQNRPNLETEEQLIKTLVMLGESTPEALLAAAYWSKENRIKAVAPIWRLIATGQIHADLYAPLSMSTPIWTTIEDSLG